MRVVALFLVLLCSNVAAQAPKRARKKGAAPANAATTEFTLPLVSLVVEGNERIPASAILAMSGLKVGDLATKEAFDAAQHKIQESGFFDRVSYGYGPVAGTHPGYAGKLQVVEAKPLYKIVFAGFPASSAELSAYLKSRDPLYNGVAPPTQAIIERWAKYLDAWTASQNQPKKVVGKLIAAASGDYLIRFQPDEPLAAVARVEFTGNDAIDTVTLQTTIGAVAYGLPYTEENFREFLDHQLKPLYEAKGLLRVGFEVTSTATAPPPVKGIVVNLKVQEGAVYRLGKVLITGVTDEDKERLANVAQLKSGEVANFDQIGQASDRVKGVMRRAGYLHVSTAVNRKLDDTAKKVDIAIAVDHGPKYEFGAMTIQGLDLNGTEAVRKQWGKKPGDAYNPDYADYFLGVIKDQGIFDHLGPTHSLAKVDDDRHVAEITLVFTPEEKKPPKRRPGDN